MWRITLVLDDDDQRVAGPGYRAQIIKPIGIGRCSESVFLPAESVRTVIDFLAAKVPDVEAHRAFEMLNVNV
jgi:hypothetical protein